jgi:methylase of polypeptide subunit release factors
MEDDTTNTMRAVCFQSQSLFTALSDVNPAYIYPNDEQELDRLDMQHHMVKLVNDGRLFFAPIHSPKRILDIGTGSGIWPIEMGASSSCHIVAYSRQFLTFPLLL